MKGPPEHVEQITADRLREVIVGLKCPAPSKNELSEMAAAYAAMQLFDRDPKVELASEPGVSARNIVTGKVRVMCPFTSGTSLPEAPRSTGNKRTGAIVLPILPLPSDGP
jgi:hypothetical protein